MATSFKALIRLCCEFILLSFGEIVQNRHSRSVTNFLTLDSNFRALVNTTEIRPCPQLRPFIRCYAYREIFAPESKMSRPVVAAHEFLITFNLTQIKYGFIKPAESEIAQAEEMMNSAILITGIGTQFGGLITTSGYSRLFTIYFTPTGFYHLFGIPAFHFTNVFEEDSYACNRHLEELHTQLTESEGRFQMVHYCEAFLLEQLSKRKMKDSFRCMLAMSSFMSRNNENCSVEKMAYTANMSMKTFERHFIEQVGASPKVFARVLRFNKAMAAKMNNFRLSWTSIAHDCGYYDQMHFIRDFREFSGTTPTDFFKHTPPLEETYLD